MPKFPPLLGSLLLLVATTGCSQPDDRKPAFAVTGKALFKGQPMAGARITFHPLGESDQRALRPTTQVDEAGTFRLTTYFKDDGAPAGEYAVTIYWPQKPAAKEQADDPNADIRDLPPDRLNRVYALPTTTPLRATVRAQSNTIDFSLP